jgi:hypothetical protein
MLFQYIQKALEKAKYKKLDDGSWFAEKNWGQSPFCCIYGPQFI